MGESVRSCSGFGTALTRSGPNQIEDAGRAARGCQAPDRHISNDPREASRVLILSRAGQFQTRQLCRSPTIQRPPPRQRTRQHAGRQSEDLDRGQGRKGRHDGSRHRRRHSDSRRYCGWTVDERLATAVRVDSVCTVLSLLAIP